MSWLVAAAVVAATPDPVRLAMLSPSDDEGGWPEAEEAVRREFALLGFELVVRPVRGVTDWTEALAEASIETGAYVVIAIVRLGDSRAVRLWLHDAVTGKALLRRVDASDVTGPRAAVTLALKVVELLQASLLEAELVPPTAPLPPPVAAVAARAGSEAPASVTLRVAGSWVSGSPWFVGADVSAGWVASSWLELGLGVGVSVAPVSVQSLAGSVQLGFGRVRVEALIRVLRGALLEASLGPAVSLVVLGAQGRDPKEGLRAALDLTAVVDLSARVRVEVHRGQFGVGAQLDTGAWLPKTVVYLAGAPATQLGPLVVSASLVGGVRW